MEDATSHVLPGSWKLENLELSVKRFFLGRGLGDTPLRSPFERTFYEEWSWLMAPSCWHLGSAAVFQLGPSSRWAAHRPATLRGPGHLCPTRGDPTSNPHLKFSLALAKTSSQRPYSLSVFLPSPLYITLFLFLPWVSDLQGSLKAFPAYC